MKHNFEARKENRAAYYLKMAQKNEQLSNGYYVRAHDIASFIPMGQPILIGHHSEKRHRADLNRIDNNMRKSFEAGEKAAYYSGKLDSMENNKAISSDDPQAIDKLKVKIAHLKEKQAFMKAANKCIRKRDKNGFLALPNATESLWHSLTENRIKGYEGYEIAYGSRDIREAEKRIEQLEKINAIQQRDETVKGVRILYNKEAGRVQLYFKGKPADDVRTILKKRYGFNWSPSEGAWQRMLNGNGIFAAKEFLSQYREA